MEGVLLTGLLHLKRRRNMISSLMTEVPEVTLVINEGGEQMKYRRAQEESLQGWWVGSHVHCCGLMTVNSVTPDSQVLACGRCNLRIPIPMSIVTFRDLSQHFRH